jgi:uncharacterized protein YjbJ (UPF0337 family)
MSVAISSSIGEIAFKGGVLMGLPNKDEIKGKVERVKGGLKEKAGQALGDNKLQDEGQAERAGGEVREGFGKAKRKVGEAIEDIGKAVSK